MTRRRVGTVTSRPPAVGTSDRHAAPDALSSPDEHPARASGAPPAHVTPPPALIVRPLPRSWPRPRARHAGFFPGDTIDGPSADIRSARRPRHRARRHRRDRLRQAGRRGGPRLRLPARRGTWSPPERVDAGLGPRRRSRSSRPPTAAVAVAFVSGGSLFAVRRPDGASGFTAPVLLAAGGSTRDRHVDQRCGLPAFTAPGASAADVRVAHLERTGTHSPSCRTRWTSIRPQRGRRHEALAGRDLRRRHGPGRLGRGRDGRHVYARRLFGERSRSRRWTSTSPTSRAIRVGRRPARPRHRGRLELRLGRLPPGLRGRRRPRTRAITRRLRGSRLEAPSTADGIAFGTGESGTTPRVELNGRGEGIVAAATSATSAAVGTPVHDDKIFPAFRFDGGQRRRSAAVPGVPGDR